MKKLTFNRETLCSLNDQVAQQVNAGGTNVTVCIIRNTIPCTSACPVLTANCSIFTTSIRTTSLPPSSVQSSEGSYIQQ